MDTGTNEKILNIAGHLDSIVPENDCQSAYEYIAAHAHLLGYNELSPGELELWFKYPHCSEMIKLNFVAGEHLVRIGYLDIALRRFMQIITVYKRRKYRQKQADYCFFMSCCHIGDIYNQMGHPFHAIEFFNKIIKTNHVHIDRAIPAYFGLGISHAYAGYYRKACKYLDKASLQLENQKHNFCENDSRDVILEIQIGRGIAYYNSFQFTKAQEIFSKVADDIARFGHADYPIDAYNQYWLGKSAHSEMDYPLALSYLEQVINNLAQENMSTEQDAGSKRAAKTNMLLSDAYHAIATVYMDIGNNSEAEKYLNLACEIRKEVLTPGCNKINESERALLHLYSEMQNNEAAKTAKDNLENFQAQFAANVFLHPAIKILKITATPALFLLRAAFNTILFFTFLLLNFIVEMEIAIGQYYSALSICRLQMYFMRSDFSNEVFREYVHFNSARAYCGLGDYKSARHHLSRLSEAEIYNVERLRIFPIKELLGDIYAGMEDYAIALDCYTKIVDAGIKNPVVWKEINRSVLMCKIAEIYLLLGDIQTADKYIALADEYAIQSKLSKRSIANVKSLLISGNICYQKNNFNEALKRLQAALKANKMILHRAECLTQIAAVYRKMGNYKEALKYQKKSLKIRKKRSGIASYISSLLKFWLSIGIGLAYFGLMGFVLVEVFRIFSTSAGFVISATIGVITSIVFLLAIGKNLNETATTLVGTFVGYAALAYTYSRRMFMDTSFFWNFIENIPGYSNLLAFVENLLEMEDVVGFTLSASDVAMFVFVAIIAFMVASVDVLLTVFGYALVVGIAAGMAASVLLQKSGKKYSKSSTALSYEEMGLTYEAMKQYDDALKNFRLAAELRKNPSYAFKTRICYRVTKMQYAINENTAYANAYELMQEYTSMVGWVMNIPQAKLRASYLFENNEYYSIILTILGNKPEFTIKLYDMILRCKFINAEAAFIQSGKDSAKTPEHAHRLKNYFDLLQQYGRLMTYEDEQSQEKASALLEEIEQAEINLSTHAREINYKRHILGINTQAVQEKLHSNHILLDYVLYRRIDPELCTSEDRYVLFALQCDRVEYFDLGSASDINNLIASLRECIAAKITEGKHSEEENKKNLQNLLAQLHERLLGPLRLHEHPLLRNKSFTDSAENADGKPHIYISPDSDLFKLPFDILTDEESRPIMDIANVSYLASGRDVLKPTGEQVFDSVVIYADPKYIIDHDTANTTEADDADLRFFPHNLRGGHGVHGNENIRLKLEKLAENELMGASLEAGAISKHVPSAAYLRDKAVKPALQTLRDANIIHIATHGFAYEAIMQHTPNSSASHACVDDVFSRCGVLLSGVKPWRKPLALAERFGDGILNGNDIMALELNNTSVVVLSACDTALGDIKTGEGQQGLRRAFEFAGAKSVICALWEVGDVPTAFFMSKFYENIASGQSALKSLQTAKIFMQKASLADLKREPCYNRELGMQYTQRFSKPEEAIARYPDQRKGDTHKPYEHPLFWAGFILQGGLEQ